MKGETQEESIQRRENMDALADARLRLREAEMLLSISKTLAGFETLDEMLMKLVEITTIEVGADRGTIFLSDSTTGELYSRVAQGNFKREIRILNDSGIAGWVFKTGEGAIVNDAYADKRFNPENARGRDRQADRLYHEIDSLRPHQNGERGGNRRRANPEQKEGTIHPG